jgi:hypothetical protein
MNFAQTLLCGILSQGSTIARLFGYRTGAQAHKENTVLALFWQNWSINRPGNLPPFLLTLLCSV